MTDATRTTSTCDMERPVNSALTRLVETVGAIGILVVLLHPFFFVIYRLMIFNTVPRDDYAGFLLWLIGAPGGAFPEAPYGYRILSMAAAAPFYYALPVIPLNNIPDAIPLPYLKATAAIAALSFLSTISASVLIYRLAVDRCWLDPIEGVVAAAFMFLFCWYAAVYAIDPFAIMLVCVGLYIIRRPVAFTVFVVASVACNEKVAIVFAIWLTIRYLLCFQDRSTLRTPCLASLAAIVVYAAMLYLLRLPGNSYQIEPTTFPLTIWENITVYPTARGMLLNVLPIAVLTGVALVSWRSHADTIGYGLFRPVDVLVIFGMAVVALTLTHLFQAGRIVMHAAPIYVVPAGVAVRTWLTARSASSVR